MDRMKFKYILFFALLAGEAMAADILDRRIAVRFQSTPVVSALAEIARLGQFEWSYNAEIIAPEARATLHASDWPVREVLYAILGDAYQFKSNGNHLILKRVKQAPGAISGYVKDPASGQRISGVTIYDKRTLRATTTNADGYYQLKVRNRAEVVVSKLSYRDTLLHVESTSPRFQSLELRIDPVQQPAMPENSGPLREAQMIGLGVERFFRTGVRQWEAWNVRAPLHRQMQVSLLPTLGTNRALSAAVSNRWSLNIIAGVSRNVEALEIGGIANFTKENLSGIQLGGVLNILHGNVSGMQAAGVLNEAGGTVEGVQMAGIVNEAAKVTGVQVAGIYNRAAPLRGMQAGLVNRAESVAGVQIGLVNKTDRLAGVQIGLVNKSAARSGVQVGLFNQSGGKKRLFINW
jgi:hypothetical protein